MLDNNNICIFIFILVVQPRWSQSDSKEEFFSGKKSRERGSSLKAYDDNVVTLLLLQKKLFAWADTKLVEFRVFFVNKDQVKETMSKFNLYWCVTFYTCLL